MLISPLVAAHRRLGGAAWAQQLARGLVAATRTGSGSGSGSSSSGSSSTSSGGSSHGWAARAAAAAAAAAGSALALLSLAPAVAHGDAQAGSDTQQQQAPAVSEAERRADFAAWMAARGADMAAAALQPCQDGSDAGLGLFATPALRQRMTHRWLGRRIGAALLPGERNQTLAAATVPLGFVLSVHSALADPDLGPGYAELLALGTLDERSAVIALLLLERAKGAASAWAPYLAVLPERISSPLWFDGRQLRELAGTTLAAATTARQAALAREWEQLQPGLSRMLRQIGVQAEPSLDDFKWATSVFWSRALALPLALPVPDDAQLQAQARDAGSGGAGGSGSGSGGAGGSGSGSSRLRIEVVEGLVPGLDFANHSQQPRCWWDVAEQPAQQQQHQHQQDDDERLQQLPPLPVLPDSIGGRHVVRLMTNRACCPATGEELTISYGDKGNEELLLLYGFALPDNPHEQLMLLCPLPPPDEWDEAFAARMQLLQARGLRPQLFLSACHFEAVTGTPPAAAAAAAAASDGAGGSSKSAGSQGSSSILPAAARQVLEVFVMEPQELAAALDAASSPQEQQQQQQAPRGSTGVGERGGAQAARRQQLGLSMALLTTFVRLLELKVVAMEGPDGTGPLEADLERLAAAEPAAGPDRAAAAPEALPAWLRHCLVYRAGQKVLARAYLAAARRELQATLDELRALMEAAGEYDDE